MKGYHIMANCVRGCPRMARGFSRLSQNGQAGCTYEYVWTLRNGHEFLRISQRAAGLKEERERIHCTTQAKNRRVI